jgi:hypothetical protein
MSARHHIQRWLERNGLAAGVLVAAGFGIFIGLTEAEPKQLPALAQGSETLWRVEIGFFSFLAFYGVWLVFVLALNGCGIIRFGPSGAEAGPVVEKKQQAALRKEAEQVEGLRQSTLEGFWALRQMQTQQRREIEELRQLLEEERNDSS